MSDKSKEREQNNKQDVKLEDLKPLETEADQVKGGRISLVDQPS